MTAAFTYASVAQCTFQIDAFLGHLVKRRQFAQPPDHVDHARCAT